MLMSAFSTRETGQPFSAASAYFWNVAASAPGTRPITSRCTAVMVQPASCFSIVNVAAVSMLEGGRFAPLSWADRAIEKQAACAAAINSSGFVPGTFSNRVLKEYGVLFKIPLAEEMTPLPSFSPPFQTALALRCIRISYLHGNWIAKLRFRLNKKRSRFLELSQ